MLARRASSLRCLYLVKLARRATLRCANGCNETSSVGTRGCEFETSPCDGTEEDLLRVTFSSMIKGIGSKTWLQSQLSGNCIFHDSSLGVSERGNSGKVNLSKHGFIVSLSEICFTKKVAYCDCDLTCLTLDSVTAIPLFSCLTWQIVLQELPGTVTYDLMAMPPTPSPPSSVSSVSSASSSFSSSFFFFFFFFCFFLFLGTNVYS